MEQTLQYERAGNEAVARSLIDLIEKRDRRGLAKAISLVENGDPEMYMLLDYAYRKTISPTLIVGITGPGGVGKSTLTDKLITAYRSQGKTVGVIAVDPSSPYTGGAFLGDRVRMGIHNSDDGVFIRSLGSRGSQGGISEGAKNALYLYKAFGFDVILVESLGVGQDETEITNFVDVNMLIMVPGLGDIIQMFKAGVREVADLFVINKSDKPEAELVKETLSNSFGIIPPELRPPIISTVASEGIGISELILTVDKTAEKLQKFAEQKRRKRLRSEISSAIIELIRNNFEEHIDQIIEKVYYDDLTPFEASQKITSCIKYIREDE